jgi:hypothetical protein
VPVPADDDAIWLVVEDRLDDPAQVIERHLRAYLRVREEEVALAGVTWLYPSLALRDRRSCPHESRPPTAASSCNRERRA